MPPTGSHDGAVPGCVQDARQTHDRGREHGHEHGHPDQLEPLEPERVPDVPGDRRGRGHAATSATATAGAASRRRALAAARWPSTTSSSVAGRPGTRATRHEGERQPIRVREPPDESPGIQLLVTVHHAVAGTRRLHGHVEERTPASKDDQPVAGLLDVGDHVRAEERGRPGRPDGVDQHVEELAARERVERGQRLVEQQDRCPRPEGDREAHLRLLPAGQLVGARVEGDVELVQPPQRVAAVEPGPPACGERQVVRDGQLAVQRGGLRDVPHPAERLGAVPPRVDPVDEETSRGRALEADAALDQRRLAGAVGADERGDRSRGDGQVQVPKRPGAPPPIPLAQAVRFQRELERHPVLQMRGGKRRARQPSR